MKGYCTDCENETEIHNGRCSCGSGRVMVGTTKALLELPEWIRLAQDGSGFHGGFWTNAAATEDSPKYYREDLFQMHQRGHENSIRAIGRLLRLCDDNGLGDAARKAMEGISDEHD